MALALGLALAEDGSLNRPKLELLFTVDEETGLTGAKKLEPGFCGDLYPDMDMISLGPTTENAHSPSERLHVPSLSHVWDFLVALLQSLSQDR